MTWRRWLQCVAWWAILAPLPCPALSADGTAIEFAAVRVGLADHYKLGIWTRVELALRARRAVQGRAEIVVPDGDGVPVRYATPAERPVSLEAGRETKVVLYARFGRPTASLTARFSVGHKQVAERTFPQGQPTSEHATVPAAVGLDEQLILAVGPSGMGMKEVLAAGIGAKLRVAELSDATDLPDRWYGYEGVDALVLSTTSPEVVGRLDADRVAAIGAWIEQGGKMLLTAGANAAQTLAGRAALARFVPGRVTDVVSLRQTEALETYCQSPAPVPQALEQGVLRAARLAGVEGAVEAREADLPLVVRAPRAFGQVVFFAAELDRRPLAQWKGRPLLVKRLLDLPAEEDDSQPVRPMMHYGFVDIAGQLRAALDHFPGVRLVPFWLVAALVVGYIGLIGPVDYFLLRRGGRMVLTWVTFPSIVLGVGVLACGLAFALKGNERHASQVDLVDVDAASGRVRGTTWAALFSPRPAVYDLALGPRLPDGRAPADVSIVAGWLGMPGHGLGGMAPHASVPSVWPREYQTSSDLSTLGGVPVPQWATKGFTARWTASARMDLQASLADQNQVLEGTLTNPLPVGLQRCLLVYGRWAYDLGDLPAGGTAVLGESVKRSELRTYLTGRRIVFDDTKSRYEEQVAPYDTAGLDPAQILQTMMFFQAAGGSRYTGLVDNYQGFVDASGLLKTGRAMLVGFVSPASAERVGSQLLSGGATLRCPGDPHTVAFRFVLPVTTAKP